ncbi:putative mitochondrion biogenesis protein, partial [Ascobolus immersus RN42]
MLAAANGFFERLRIRTKWTLIRQMRPYTFDEITAFLSWLFVGHLLWFLLGTTTFFSIVVLLVNTVLALIIKTEFLAGVIGNYLTKQTGIQVVFESAIVPRWKDGCITLSNVFVSRRPGNKKKASVRKGSSVTAAAAAAAALKAEEEEHARASHHEEPEDQNYTQFDVTFDTVNVTLSFARWMNGKGLLQDVEIKGVRGVLDRTHVVWDESIDPRSYKHVHEPGDFEIERFKIEDLLLTVYQPDGFRPFPVSIFSMELPQFRKQWLFYDLINANHMSGSYDNSLFTIHPKQTHGLSQAQELDDNEFPWKKMSRLRIDGLNIEHLNHGVEGPFSWIASGTVDISADLLVPTDDDSAFTQLFQQIVSSVEQTAPLAETPENNDTDTLIEPPVEKFVVLDLHCKLNDVKAAVPVFTSDLSYVNNALIRPIVAYINTRRTYIPINCRVIKRLSEFDGSWTIFDSGLMDDLSAETYEAFVRNVADEDVRRRRMRKVGLWSLQMIAQLLALAMAGNLA